MSYKKNITRYKNKIILHMISGVFKRTIFGDVIPRIFTKEELDKYKKDQKLKN